jgi:1-acyl-sn-glycerol-3-phosphate acyltransferase
MLLRLLKGQVMGLLYLCFGVGIFVELLLILPLVWLVNRLRGFDADRMQGVHRALMGHWLFWLWVFRLLVVRPPRGAALDRPCVIVANHPGLFDVLAIIRAVPRLSVLVNAKLARVLPLGPIFRQSGYVLSPRFDSLGSATKAFAVAQEQLDAGNRLLLFPEGTRSPRDELGRFRSGAFKIARQAGVPIQPVFVRNLPRFMGHGDHWHTPPWRCSELELEFWEPIDPPAAGEEEAAARELERRYRAALGISSPGA